MEWDKQDPSGRISFWYYVIPWFRMIGNSQKMINTKVHTEHIFLIPFNKANVGPWVDAVIILFGLMFVPPVFICIIRCTADSARGPIGLSFML